MRPLKDESVPDITESVTLQHDARCPKTPFRQGIMLATRSRRPEHVTWLGNQTGKHTRTHRHSQTNTPSRKLPKDREGHGETCRAQLAKRRCKLSAGLRRQPRRTQVSHGEENAPPSPKAEVCWTKRVLSVVRGSFVSRDAGN